MYRLQNNSHSWFVQPFISNLGNQVTDINHGNEPKINTLGDNKTHGNL